MTDRGITGKRVAILATDGVEQAELTEPRKALDDAGAKTYLVSPKTDVVKAWQHDKWGDEISVDLALTKARADDFDALLPSRRSDESRSPSHGQECCRFRARIFRSGKAGGCDMSRPMDARRGRRGSGQDNDFVAITSN
jgi:Putative intracellular protease/amidase